MWYLYLFFVEYTLSESDSVCVSGKWSDYLTWTQAQQYLDSLVELDLENQGQSTPEQ